MLKKFLQNYHRWPIQRKLLGVLLLMVQFALLLFGAVMIASYYFVKLDDARNTLRSQAALLAKLAPASIVFTDRHQAGELLDGLKQDADIRQAVLFGPDGNIFAKISAHPESQPWRNIQGALQPVPSWGGSIVHVETVVLDNKPLGWLAVEKSLDSFWREVGLWLFYALIAWYLTIVASSWLAYWLGGTLIRPLLQLTDLTRSVSESHNFSLRADASGQDELGDLAQGINMMLERIDARKNVLEQELEEHARMHEELDYLAHHDQVTNLPNRRFFNRRLESALADAARFQESKGLMFVDLDNFKQVNDQHGHHMGDLLLMEVSRRVIGVLRSGDVICRLGGDEFGVILDTLRQAEDAEIIAKKILASLAEPIQLEGAEVQISASLGIASCPQDATDPITLQRHADQAMYHAKQMGKNTFCIYSK